MREKVPKELRDMARVWGSLKSVGFGPNGLDLDTGPNLGHLGLKAGL